MNATSISFGLLIVLFTNRPAPLDAQETTDRRVSVTKDVPVLRIDHISTESALLGVWRGKPLRAVGGPIVKK